MRTRFIRPNNVHSVLSGQFRPTRREWRAFSRSNGNRAAGDAATPADAKGTPKAGVYAVRMGPQLVGTLTALLSGVTPDSSWRPQRRFLALLSTGDDRAIASWGPFAAEGRWAMTLKDRIDRRFLTRFSVVR